MASPKHTEHILGVTVSGRTLYAVLLAHGTDGPEVVRRFTRQQAAANVNTPGSMPDDLDGMEETGGDFSISFGDEGGGSMDDMFLASEFGGLDAGDVGAAVATDVASFALELGDILAECEDIGYSNLTLSFALGASDIVQTEVRLPEEKVSGGKKGADASASPSPNVGTKKLLTALDAQYDSSFNKETVTFIPLPLSEEGIPRYLALFPKPNDPITSTLRELRADRRSLPTVKLMDTEVTLFLGVIRASEQSEESDDASGYTLLVRAGAEDTLVLFLKGDKLHHSENLRSLTAYEAPETICSRILLLQDEYGIGEIQKVLALSDEREHELIESFEMFFPEAAVRSVRDLVPSSDTIKLEGGRSGSSVVATAAAMRLSKQKEISQAFDDVNLLPKQLMRKQFRLPVTWHVMALYVLLFCTVLFFIGRYFSLQGDITDYRAQIEEIDATLVDADPRVLQARIDSLQSAHQQYVRGLEVLEELLVGSDKWTRSMEQAAREMAGVEGVWVHSWQPSGSQLQLQGHSTSRDRVVMLAERLDGRIETLTFAEIREWPVYSFRMQIPVREELPEAARYLRERVAEMREAEGDQPLSSVSLPGVEEPSSD